ncbi:glycoside hydrolase family 3 C-terminal domain-containing protein [Yinghuangia sp. YIM S09857]|uniref:glycoside hydrolase family 3 C-terminal domain-containing protein n=1 Tax=Yinghuangia sp. YIM S09857 TaxID=3436929 RepID=UPI003F53E2DC
MPHPDLPPADSPTADSPAAAALSAESPSADPTAADPTAAELTLAEKASLTSGLGQMTTKAIAHAGIPSVTMSDGPHGLRLQGDDPENGQLALRAVAPATCFPPAVALGSSWDVGLAHRVAGAIAAEAAAHGIGVVLGPGVNLKRSPLCGRNFEYFSEDPVVSAELGGAMVRGLQDAGVGATLKHYAANNQETDRMRVSADIDERPLREIYLRAFERIVRRDRPWAVMCAYNGVNGVPLSENTRLLTDVLRGEWGFDGLVMSDWGAVRNRVAALRAGLDLEMPPTAGRTDREVEAAVDGGELDAEVLNRSVARLIAFARRSARPASGDADALHARHHRLAGEAADNCVVLLKNDGALLPLDPAAGTVAVIGELARTPRYQGGGSSQVNATRVDVPLDCLRGLADGAVVEFAPGYALPDGPDPEADPAALAEDAVRLAAGSDTVVLFLGLPRQDESEGYDRDHIDLPEAQVALLRRVVAANPRVAVVLSNGGVVRTAPWDHDVPALVEGWLLGQAGGGALARVLFGAVNPSGKLAETVPVRLEDGPSFLSFPGAKGHVRYGEGVFVGYRGYDAARRDVGYPFGHGLSYTTFAYRDLVVDTTPEGFAVHVTVANTGGRAGREVVQIYTAPPAASRVERAVRELRGFASVTLGAGESRTVTVEFARADLAYHSVRDDGWRVEGGTYRFEAAASSRDVRVAVDVEVAGDAPRARLTARHTLGEWLDHPVGGPLLMARLAALSGDRPSPLADNPMLLRAAVGVPVEVIADFAQGLISQEALRELEAEVAAGVEPGAGAAGNAASGNVGGA